MQLLFTLNDLSVFVKLAACKGLNETKYLPADYFVTLCNVMFKQQSKTTEAFF